MTDIKLFSTLAFSAASLLVPFGPAAADSSAYRISGVTPVITISCYRGPWNDVIWDRPNPEFTDSLVSAGHTFPEAHAIAERVCRDPGAVGRPGVMRAAMTDILRTSPPGN